MGGKCIDLEGLISPYFSTSLAYIFARFSFEGQVKLHSLTTGNTLGN